MISPNFSLREKLSLFADIHRRCSNFEIGSLVGRNLKNGRN